GRTPRASRRSSTRRAVWKERPARSNRARVITTYAETPSQTRTRAPSATVYGENQGFTQLRYRHPARAPEATDGLHTVLRLKCPCRPADWGCRTRAVWRAAKA